MPRLVDGFISQLGAVTAVIFWPRYGFYNWERVHKYAWTAYPRGAQMEFWVEKATPYAGELFQSNTGVLALICKKAQRFRRSSVFSCLYGSYPLLAQRRWCLICR